MRNGLPLLPEPTKSTATPSPWTLEQWIGLGRCKSLFLRKLEKRHPLSNLGQWRSSWIVANPYLPGGYGTDPLFNLESVVISGWVYLDARTEVRITPRDLPKDSGLLPG